MNRELDRKKEIQRERREKEKKESCRIMNETEKQSRPIDTQKRQEAVHNFNLCSIYRGENVNTFEL